MYLYHKVCKIPAIVVDNPEQGVSKM